MREFFLILLALFFVAFTTASWAQCPEDTVDSGVCDSLYIEPWPPDLDLDNHDGPPYFVRVHLLVTHDLTGPFDSLGGTRCTLCTLCPISAQEAYSDTW
jgi:hypothetical protein